jgi:cytochrome c oxidase subunit 1/cytochrome c oxidase subunit I+III
MHILGLLGMPRRVYTYPYGMGWGGLNLVISIGSLMFAAGVLLLLINIAVSLKRGKVAGADPWGAPTLEWAIPSPPPAYNFAVIPIVASRHPLWEGRLGDQSPPARSKLTEGYLLDRGRETLGTTPLDARPNLILEMPEDSLAPLLLTVGLCGLFIGGLAHAWWLAAFGVIIGFGALLDWLWPRFIHADLEKAHG